MCTHNICFSVEIRKLQCGYPFLSGGMLLEMMFQNVKLSFQGK